MDVTLPDGVVVQGVPDGTTKEQLLNKLLQVKHPSAQALLDQTAQQNTLKEMGTMDRFNAGMGGAFTRIGQGAKQMLGMPTDYQQDKGATNALNQTGAGMAGNIAGNVAAFAPAAVIPGAASIAGAGAIGAATGALQPTENWQERLKNMGEGGALGGAVQTVARYPKEILDAAKGLGRGLKATIEPLYEGGREQILSRALRNSTGGNPDVAARLAAGKELVPGSMPTAAEVAESPGIAALQRTASATNPEAYGTRAAQQNEARVKELTDLAGTQGKRDFFAADRSAAADALYTKAYDKGVDIRRDPTSGQFLPKAQIAGRQGEITKLMQRPAIQDAMESARTLAANEGVKMNDMAGSVKGLDYLKRALDDKIGAASGNEQRVLVDLKNRLLTTLDTLSPDYAAARTTFRDMSKPINQMDIAQEIADKSINKLTGAIQPQAYARALTDETAQRATGFGKASLEGTLEPDQLSRLTALKDDLARSVAARDMGRGAGSDTVQKLSMSNLLRRSGLSENLLNTPVAGRLANWAYEAADNKMRQQLAQALLNPQDAAQLLGKAGKMPMPTATNPALGERQAMLARMLALPATATLEGSR